MVKCKICEKEFKDNRALSYHVKSHKLTSREYYDKYIGESNKCNVCGKETRFISITSGYCDHCSYECTRKSDVTKKKRRDTCNKKFGSDYFFSSTKGKIKVKEGNLKKYGVKNPAQSEEIKAKIQATNLERYGESCVLKNEDVKKKIKITCLKKYGVTHHLKDPNILKKQIETVRKKFGVCNIAKNKDIRNQIIKTCIEKYGNPSVFGSNYFKEIVIEKFLNNFGVINPMKSLEIRKLHSKIQKRNMFKKIKSGQRTNYKYVPLFSYDEFKGVHHKHKYLWFCLNCSTKFNDHIDDGHIPRCPICVPINKGFSKMEKEISEFIQSLNIDLIENDRHIIPPKELDIYIPSHNLAIEFDGLYWHSEITGRKNQLYHLEKTEQCEEKGIQLLHIFEDEWINKPLIVKSMIKNKLGKSTQRMYGRKCEIVQIPFRDARYFFNQNHIQGCGTPSKLCFGLMYDMNLVAVASFSKPRYNKKYDYELVRYATKRNTSVIGGFSKLLSYFVKNFSPKNILSYADRRYSTGGVYDKCGFTQLKTSKPNYFYIEKDLTRSSRVKYQKHKLSQILDIFDPILTEWQNMQLNDYDRIWDCGNLVFLYECE